MQNLHSLFAHSLTMNLLIFFKLPPVCLINPSSNVILDHLSITIIFFMGFPCSTISSPLDCCGWHATSVSCFLSAPGICSVSAWSVNFPSPLKPRNLQANPLNLCLLCILATASFPSRTSRCFLRTPAAFPLHLVPHISLFNFMSLRHIIALRFQLTNVLVLFLIHQAPHKRARLAQFWQGTPNQDES